MGSFYYRSERTKPVPGGLKARATLAWGKAPGRRHLTIGGLKARAKCLIRKSWIAAAVLLPIFGMSSFAHAQIAPPLRIRIINAKTNQPIPNERLNVALKVDQIGSVAMATD